MCKTLIREVGIDQAKSSRILDFSNRTNKAWRGLRRFQLIGHDLELVLPGDMCDEVSAFRIGDSHLAIIGCDNDLVFIIDLHKGLFEEIEIYAEFITENDKMVAAIGVGEVSVFSIRGIYKQYLPAGWGVRRAQFRNNCLEIQFDNNDVFNFDLLDSEFSSFKNLR